MWGLQPGQLNWLRARATPSQRCRIQCIARCAVQTISETKNRCLRFAVRELAGLETPWWSVMVCWCWFLPKTGLGSNPIHWAEACETRNGSETSVHKNVKLQVQENQTPHKYAWMVSNWSGKGWPLPSTATEWVEKAKECARTTNLADDWIHNRNIGMVCKSLSWWSSNISCQALLPHLPPASGAWYLPACVAENPPWRVEDHGAESHPYVYLGRILICDAFIKWEDKRIRVRRNPTSWQMRIGSSQKESFKSATIGSYHIVEL